jgi:hypothetical protein
MNYLPPEPAAQLSALIDDAARQALRPLSAIRRIYLVPGRVSSSAPHPPSDSDRAIVGPVDHWVQVLSHLAADLGFGTFVFAAPTDPHSLRTLIV